MAGVVELKAAQVQTAAAWAVDGPDFVGVFLVSVQPSFVSTWEVGDVLAVQGDASVQIGTDGKIKDAVPPIGPNRS